jgi:hypothetical protein
MRRLSSSIWHTIFVLEVWIYWMHVETAVVRRRPMDPWQLTGGMVAIELPIIPAVYILQRKPTLKRFSLLFAANVSDSVEMWQFFYTDEIRMMHPTENILNDEQTPISNWCFTVSRYRCLVWNMVSPVGKNARCVLKSSVGYLDNKDNSTGWTIPKR